MESLNFENDPKTRKMENLRHHSRIIRLINKVKVARRMLKIAKIQEMRKIQNTVQELFP